MDKFSVNELFSASLRYFMKYSGQKMTQEELAEKAGLSQGYVGRLSAGKGKGTEETRRKIAGVFGYDGNNASYEDFLELGKKLLCLPDIDIPGQNRERKNKAITERKNDQRQKPRGIFADKNMARAIISKLAEIEAHEDYYLLIGIVVHQVHNILIKKQDNEKTRELVKGLGVYS